ncbi:flagellar hook-length control protein FliK [Dyella nitratireducens]|uniref:Flagellar hook-length control protein-like C-terminal domain-containing protein n=1 Tax=Dyella nitratireducens TaxID=1849580 RepID=A0ABQ1FSC0_9GAMM|nr:flagellar hook-length control protein FliK [Dyella nitratireducens]GGA27547.1 hypothetical protein GCM10010981_15360 [Dyella nitratireducens]GLQ43399.1 hypothetical protein GCM10007902_32490 [Dyella nitratireducens]
MSASPLPALPVTPTPAQPAPSTANRNQHSDTSFNSHLRSAQQASQDASQADSQNNDQGQNGNDAQNTSTQASSASDNTSKPGADANDTQKNAANDNGPGIDLTGGVGTLASAVLSLIDHATSDTHGDAKPAADGTAKPSTGTKRQATDAQSSVTAGIVPMPLPAIAPVATTTGSNTNASQAGNALVGGIASGSSSKSSLDLRGDDGLSASDSSASGTNGSADTSSVTQGITDNTQALAGSLASAGHAALPAATAFTADNTSPGSTADITALGNLTATAPALPSGTTGTHSLTANAPVGSSGFAKELGQQITWLSGQDVKQAQIRLNPQNLGPLDVKVSVEHGRVDVSFVTQHPDTTAAVQQSLGQLHQMLGGQGLSLGHATVGQHGQQQFAGQQGQQAQATGNAGDDVADTPIATAARVAIGLVDAFA